MDMKEAIEAKKEAYFQRTFGMSYKKASTFVIEYGSDLDNLENVDEEKEFFKNIKELLENEDMIESYISSKNTYSLYQVNNIKKKIAKECAKTYISKFENLDKKVDECLKSNDENYHEILEFDGKKIDMVKPKGKLDILLHSTDTNFLSARSTPESFKEIWENAKTKEDHILSSVYINQEFMGMPPVGNSGVMYGFTNIPKENIKLIGTSDINTYSRKFSFDSTTKQYMSANTIANSSRRVYDEVAIEKYAETYITGAESTAQAKNITTEQLIKDELGFNSIDDYRAEAKKEVESFVKKRLAVYEAAKKKHIKIGSGEYEELLPAYASNFGYNTEEEFEYACTPGSIANEMLYDKTTAKLKGSK